MCIRDSFGIDANGKVVRTIVRAGVGVARAKGGHAKISMNGIAEPDRRMGSMTALLMEAAKNKAKADALALVGRQSPSWSELYLVFELVKANVGGRMLSEGWIAKNDATLFTRTANSYTALGKTGRHGKDRGDPPSIPMHQKAAADLMRVLVCRWLRDTGPTHSHRGRVTSNAE